MCESVLIFGNSVTDYFERDVIFERYRKCKEEEEEEDCC